MHAAFKLCVNCVVLSILSSCIKICYACHIQSRVYSIVDTTNNAPKTNIVRTRQRCKKAKIYRCYIVHCAICVSNMGISDGVCTMFPGVRNACSRLFHKSVVVSFVKSGRGFYSPFFLDNSCALKCSRLFSSSSHSCSICYLIYSSVIGRQCVRFGRFCWFFLLASSSSFIWMPVACMWYVPVFVCVDIPSKEMTLTQSPIWFDGKYIIPTNCSGVASAHFALTLNPNGPHGCGYGDAETHLAMLQLHNE